MPAAAAADDAAPPADNAAYKTRAYWESRFAREEAYEWLAGYEVVEHLVEPVLLQGRRQGGDAAPAPAKVLVVGCGNSGFSMALARAAKNGAADREVTSIDFSETVIAGMREKYPELRWETMDMRSLDGFEDGAFDFVVDKAAMDALVTDEGDPWNPNEETRNDTGAMMNAVARVLAPGGVFVQITFQQPHFRKRYLEHAALSAPEVTEINHGMGYFFITQTKNK